MMQSNLLLIALVLPLLALCFCTHYYTPPQVVGACD